MSATVLAPSDAAYIMDTLPIVQREDEALFGLSGVTSAQARKHRAPSPSATLKDFPECKRAKNEA